FERELPIGLDCTLAVLDPKFERVALCRGAGPVEIRSVSELRLLATLPARMNWPATFGQWSGDGRVFAVRRNEGTYAGPDVEVWDVASARWVMSLSRTRWNAFSFHPRLPRILGAAEDNSVAIWDLETGQ